MNYYSGFKDAVETDLFAGLQRAVSEDRSIESKYDVESILSTWSRQKGYPVLIVNRVPGENTIKLTQSRYLSQSSNLTGHNDSSRWWIPYNYATRRSSNFTSTTPDGWFSPDDVTTTISGIEPNDWIVFNKQQTGYYRVFYSMHDWQLLAKLLNSDNFTVIHRLSRAQIIDDAFEFVRNGHLADKVFFDLISYLDRETDYAPWAAAGHALNEFNRMLIGSSAYSKYHHFVANLVEKAYLKFGIQNLPKEPWLNKYTRDIVIELASAHGLEKCLNSVHLQLTLRLNYNQQLHPNDFELTYKNGARTARQEELQTLWEQLNRSNNTYERLAIASAFGLAPLNLAEQYLEKILSEDIALLKPERLALLNAVQRNGEAGLSLAIRFIAKNAAKIHKKVESLDKIAKEMATRIFTHKVHHEVRFYSQNIVYVVA